MLRITDLEGSYHVSLKLETMNIHVAETHWIDAWDGQNVDTGHYDHLPYQ